MQSLGIPRALAKSVARLLATSGVYVFTILPPQTLIGFFYETIKTGRSNHRIAG